MTIKKTDTPKPAQPAKPVNVPAKATSTGDARDIIDRKLVASALDRPGDDGKAPDGVLSADEFKKAGITVEDAAKGVINEPGESGDAISVNELSRALADNRVTITGDGAVRLVDGFAQVPNGRIETSSPWVFPDIPDLRVLENVVRAAPDHGMNPNNPGLNYTEQRIRRIGEYRGQSLGMGEYVGDSRGNQVSTDANGQYPPGSHVWERYTIVHWDDLADDLQASARNVRDAARNGEDPQLRQIYSDASRLVDSSFWGDDESRARRLYSGLAQYNNLHVPSWPRSRMSRLDDGLNTAKTALNDHFRILQQVPVERARDVVSREVDRLKGFLTPTKLGVAGAGAAIGAAAAFFGLPAAGAALAGGALMGAAAGAGVLCLGIGYFVGKMMDDSKAVGLQEDLKVLETISPEANKQTLNQQALASYTLLQGARDVRTLARVKDYDREAASVQGNVEGVTNKIKSQAESLRGIQALVNKYASK